MTSDLIRFETAMDELRSAYKLASGNTQAQADIKSKFDEVVLQKDIYLVGALKNRAQSLNALVWVLEDAIKTIEIHIANFPLNTLRNLLGNEYISLKSDAKKTEKVLWVAEPETNHSESLHHSLSTSGTSIIILKNDLDALCRVAQSEVGHFAKYGRKQLEGGLAAVVDTIINRTAHKGFPLKNNLPNTIQAVVDDPFQFSAINTKGTWTALPEAKQEIVQIITEHLRNRASGSSCTVKGATHFLNPFLSSANAISTWGNYVVQNAIAIFGNYSKKDVHYHGFAPNTALASPYLLKFGESETHFTGAGVTLGTGVGAHSIASRVVDLCENEHTFFAAGKKKENDDPQYLRVGEYWSVIDKPINGRTEFMNDKTKRKYNPAWSSVFISWILKNAGAGNKFRYSQAHCHYVQDFINEMKHGMYKAMHPDFYAPKVGDILHFGRETAKKYDFLEAQTAYQADSFYPSHSDIVVAVDTDFLSTIGGNVANSVGLKKIAIDKDGKLKPRREDGNEYPWIAVLKLLA